MNENIKNIIAERIKYHSNKQKYGYFIGNDCIDICASDILDDVIKAGYRKQSETVKEFAEKLKKELFVNCVIIQTIYDTQKEDMDSFEAFQIIDELAEQYGKEEKMKSILMSIQPKLCKAIVHDSCYIHEDAYGAVDKLIVRKTRPKEKDLPIDVYICCYEPHKKAYRQTGQSCKTGYYTYPPYNIPYGKVFAKFTLNEVVDIEHSTMLYKKDKVEHAKGKPLYGWKIDNLTIFDKPKELSEFYPINSYLDELGLYQIPLYRPPQSWQYVEE